MHPLSFSPTRSRNLGQNKRRRWVRSTAGMLGALALSLTGCETQGAASPPQSLRAANEAARAQPSDALTLREGDVVKISVPGTPNLDTVQTIRRDGRIALALIGEVRAAGQKPAELQAELVKLYSPQLVSKEINVSVVSSAFTAFVTGAVLKPGKISSDRALTVLDAVMEAGGPDFAKANLKAVVVIRQTSDENTENFTINLKQIFEGKSASPFYLKPMDIVYVPERLALF